MEKEKLEKIYNINNWLPIHIQQLFYLRNLILLLAFGALGFTLNILSKDLELIFKILFMIISILYLITICLGFIITYNESENYRYKYKISRLLIKNKDYDHKNDEDECTKLENNNRCLIKSQIIIFLSTVILETILYILNITI